MPDEKETLPSDGEDIVDPVTEEKQPEPSYYVYSG